EADGSAAGEATRTAEQARQRARRAAREAGFPEEKTAEAAALSDQEAARLASEVEHYRRDLHAAVLRVADLAAELAGREVSDDDLVAVEIASADQERMAIETGREADRLEIAVRNLAKRVERAAELAHELAESQREHGLHRRLADDLRGERFQAFVLDESFR